MDTLVYESKRRIMHSALSSEVTVLSHMLDEISSTDRRARDFTRKALTDAIRETIACFPVYRTYIDERGEVTERDRKYIQEAIVRAKRRNPNMPAAVLDSVHELLFSYQGRRVSACVDTPQGSRLRGYFRLEGAEEAEWVSWLEDQDVSTGMLELCFPGTERSGSVRLRLDIEAPDGTTASFHSPDTITSLAGENVLRFSTTATPTSLCFSAPASFKPVMASALGLA